MPRSEHARTQPLAARDQWSSRWMRAHAWACSWHLVQLSCPPTSGMGHFVGTVSTHTKWMTQSPARSQRQREGVSSCHSCTAGGLVCLCKRAGSEQPPVTISDQPRGTRRDSMLGRKAAAAPQCVGLPRCRLARVVEEEPAQLHRSAHLRRALRVWPLVTDRRDERREFHSFVSHK